MKIKILFQRETNNGSMSEGQRESAKMTFFKSAKIIQGPL